MNSQYVPQQIVPPQTYPGNRPSPSQPPLSSTAPQNYENISLMPQKPGPVQVSTSGLLSSTPATSQYSPNKGVFGSGLRQQLPPNQPPQTSQEQKPSSGFSNQFRTQPSAEPSVMNSSLQVQNGTPNLQNRPQFSPPSVPGQIKESELPPGQIPPAAKMSSDQLMTSSNHLPTHNKPAVGNNNTRFNQPVPSNLPSSNNQPFQPSPPNNQTFAQRPPNNQPGFNQPPHNIQTVNKQVSPNQPPDALSKQQMPGPPMNRQSTPSAYPPSQGQLPKPGQPFMTAPPPAQGQHFLATGQRPPNQYSQGPFPQVDQGLKQHSYFNQPPMPPLNNSSISDQSSMGPNNIAHQMQNMNLGSGQQYPGGTMNEDMGPHMPPPLGQQRYMNGQQAAPPGPPAGYPPVPGQQFPSSGGISSYPQHAYQQPQQARRLDPDHMPSPIQVTQDDQQNRSGIFCTNQKGLVPPLVTTNFIVQDQGNASPRFIRSSMYNVPISQDIMKQTAVPFSLVISPMAKTIDQEYPPPIVNFGELGPVRCIRCKAYMCPFMQFIDSGRRFQCLFCKATTDVPAEYFQHLDHTGQRLDRYERPELVLGAYEFVATPEYCRNNTLPKPPAIVFIIDVSYNSVKSGLVHLLCAKIKDIIKNLPVDQGQQKSNMRVGFITYNSSVHFYNIKGNLAVPQMLIVGDIQEMFMPLLDGFLCSPEESEPVIDSLMQQIPTMFGDTRETETILLPAITAGLEALKASDGAGKLMVFHSSLPTAEGPGKLKNRDDRKLLGTDKEKTILTPQSTVYNQLGQDCVAAGCSVDLFLFNNSYIDIATIGQVSRLTGGEVYKYTYFQADVDGERLIADIITNISRPIAFDAIMRVRTSTGIRPTDFYGHFYMSNTTDMELAAIDCDKAVAIEIKHDDKLSEEDGVYIQAALLYTSCSGQRRLRVLNLSLKTCSQMAELYRNCDCDTLINYIAKQATYKLYEHNPKAVKDSIVTRAAQILATYRKNCASPSSAGQLILPECMKLLPLYVNCLLKSDALSGGSDLTVDDRSYLMQQVMIMDIPTSVNYFYPRLIPLIDLDPTQDPLEIPPPIRCTIEKMNEQGVYILENGIHMFLWIGLGVNPNFTQQVFGVPSAIQIDIEKTKLPELDNPLSVAVRNIISKIRIQRHRFMRLTLVRQREKLEPVFKHFLAEDRSSDGSPSYVDFLIHMHKEIRSLLS